MVAGDAAFLQKLAEQQTKEEGSSDETKAKLRNPKDLAEAGDTEAVKKP